MKRIDTGWKLGCLLVAAAAGLSSCATHQPSAMQSPATVRNIEILTAQRASVPDLLEAIGTVHSAQSTEVASQMMGNIVRIRAHEGDQVRRGEVLATIDAAQPRSALDRAKAVEIAAEQQLVAADSDLALAESTLKRYQILYDRKSVSPQEFDEMKARSKRRSPVTTWQKQVRIKRRLP
jgi:multidrug efflux system membrane fusion protein